MEERSSVQWRDLSTGLIFIAGLAVLAWLGMTIGKNTGLLTKHRYVNLFVTDVQGLTEGNLVSVSGKKVGVVQSIAFAQQRDTNGVLVRLDIRDEYFDLLTRDSRATIKSLGVLGDKYVDVALGHSHEHLQDGGTLAVAREAGMEELTASAISTMRNVSALTAQISHGEGTLGKLVTTNDLNDRLTTITGNLALLSRNLTHGRGIGAQLAGNAELAGDMQRTLRNLSDLSSRIQDEGEISRLVLGAPLVEKLGALSDRTDTLLRSLTVASDGVAHYASATDGGVYGNVNTSLQALQGAMTSLDSLLKDLKQNPKRYIHVSVF